VACPWVVAAVVAIVAVVAVAAVAATFAGVARLLAGGRRPDSCCGRSGEASRSPGGHRAAPSFQPRAAARASTLPGAAAGGTFRSDLGTYRAGRGGEGARTAAGRPRGASCLSAAQRSEFLPRPPRRPAPRGDPRRSRGCVPPSGGTCRPQRRLAPTAERRNVPPTATPRANPTAEQPTARSGASRQPNSGATALNSPRTSPDRAGTQAAASVPRRRWRAPAS
jgi:hypothetical protein